MKYVLNPSLEHMALVKIGISLLNQNDVRALISKLSYKDLYLYTIIKKKIEETVTEKVTRLPLPQLLKEKVIGVIQPLGKQIFQWMQYYHKYDGWVKYEYDFPIHLPAELCWTPQGTVDRKKTSEVLLRDENLDVSRRYRQACDYCLEDDIIRFWNRLPEDVRDYHWNNFPVVSFWSDNMKRGGVGHVSYKDVFLQSAVCNNKVAAEYFLRKLTPEEREESLVEAAKNARVADVLCFVLSKLNEEQQMEVFKFNTYRVLRCFLEWPWQSFFIKIANYMWEFILKDDYKNILDCIIHTVRDGKKDWNYLKLLREFWKKSPSSLKDSFIDEVDQSSLFLPSFHIKDKEIIRLILKDASLTVKKKLIYCYNMSIFCQRCIRENNWDLLEFCIQECLPSKNEMLKFKEEFERFVMHSYFKEHFERKKHKWDEIFHSSEDSIFQCNKRSLEESECSSSKKFHSLQ